MTLQQFLEVCKTLPNSDAVYFLAFPDDEVREAFYAEAERLGVDLAAEPEPMRASMIALGEHYSIQVLIDY